MDLICPRCKTSKYRNPAVRFMVNVCGHSLCTNCVELQFNRGSGKCEICKVNLKKGNFRPQMFLSAEVERGVFVRKRILKELNKTSKDFKTNDEYNDYLEEIETIIFNLSNGINVEEMNAKIEKYKNENELPSRNTKTNNGTILDDEDRDDEEDNVDNTKVSNTNMNESLDKLTEGVFRYKESQDDNQGPPPPSAHQLQELGYLKSMGRESTESELAGGFSLEVACHKSLCYAMTGLFVMHKVKS